MKNSLTDHFIWSICSRDSRVCSETASTVKGPCTLFFDLKKSGVPVRGDLPVICSLSYLNDREKKLKSWLCLLLIISRKSFRTNESALLLTRPIFNWILTGLSLVVKCVSWAKHFYFLENCRYRKLKSSFFMISFRLARLSWVHVSESLWKT